MQRKHSDEPKKFKIYALTQKSDDNYAYIGKTSGTRLSAAFSHHVCGRIEATAGFFDKDEYRPQLYLLEEGVFTTSDAYRRVVAWAHIFRKNGFFLLNHAGTVRHAKNLSYATEQIVGELEREPLECVLHRTLVSRPVDADDKQVPIVDEHAAEKVVQMNVRMTKKNKERFSAFCKQHHLNQREAFSLLLDRTASFPANMGLEEIMSERISATEALKEENRQLEKKLTVLSKKCQNLSRTTLTEIKNAVSDYFQLLVPSKSFPVPIEVTTYRGFKQDRSDASRYEYPPEEGGQVITLTALLWGASMKRALFVMGEDGEGNGVKLRYYPREEFIGVPIDNSAFAYESSRWYVGYKAAPDGAMDITFAFPLDVTEEKPLCNAEECHQIKKPPLDEIMRNAGARRES